MPASHRHSRSLHIVHTLHVMRKVLAAFAMQVWLAKCIPLNKMVAIKLMDLENFGANLVSAAVPAQPAHI